MSMQHVELFYKEITCNHVLFNELFKTISNCNVKNKSEQKDKMAQEILKTAKHFGFNFTIDELEKYQEDSLKKDNMNNIF